MARQDELRINMGIRLMKIRKALGFGHEKMASFFGIQRPSYTKHETGMTFPSYHALHNLSGTFRVSLDWLITGRGAMFFQEKVDDGKLLSSQYKGGEKLLSPEQQELLDYMEKIPLFYHEVMAHFQRLKWDNKEMVASVLKK